MDEAEWLAATDPTPMLEFLRGRASDRKLKLFAAACCRRIHHLISDARFHLALDAIENHAEGLMTPADFDRTRLDVDEAVRVAKRAEWEGEAEAQFCYTADYCLICVSLNAGCAVRVALLQEPGRGIGISEAMLPDLSKRDFEREDDFRESHEWAAYAVSSLARSNALRKSRKVSHRKHEAVAEAARLDELRNQAGILRDIIVNPFRPVSIDATWLTPPVADLAKAIYAERSYDLLPILGDALEDAGCPDAAMLAHCRAQPDHVRGCWVVDLLLGKG